MNLIDFKVIVIGDANVGKSSLINRFVDGAFLQDGRTKDREKDIVISGSRVRFHISEISDPNGVRLHNYPHVYLLCFSLSEPGTLLNSLGVWYNKVRGTGVPLILVGCKSDVCGVEKEQIRVVSSQVQAMDYIETSSKLSQTSVCSMFESAYALCSNRSPISPVYKRRSRSAVRETSTSETSAPSLRTSLPKDCPRRDSSLLSSRSKTGSLSSVSTKSKSSTLSSTRSDSSMISISTKTPRVRRRGETKEADKGERMVTIRCERLSSEREYEQVEIEIPLSVYNNMQTQSTPLSNRNSSNRKSLVNRLRNLFV